MSALTDRLAALRETTNISTTSDAKNPTTLETYLRLYNKSKGECYKDYMQGAKALHKFLSPIAYPKDLIFYCTLRSDLLDNYAVGQLANIITGTTFGGEHGYVCNLINYYTAKHTIEEVESWSYQL